MKIKNNDETMNLTTGYISSYRNVNGKIDNESLKWKNNDKNKDDLDLEFIINGQKKNMTIKMNDLLNHDVIEDDLTNRLLYDFYPLESRKTKKTKKMKKVKINKNQKSKKKQQKKVKRNKKK